MDSAVRARNRAPGGPGDGARRTELILTGEDRPLRLAIDTLWTGGRSTVAGLVAGALLGGALGVIAGSELGEETAGTARTLLTVGSLGAAGGGLLGALIGAAIPRWQPRFP